MTTRREFLSSMAVAGLAAQPVFRERAARFRPGQRAPAKRKNTAAKPKQALAANSTNP